MVEILTLEEAKETLRIEHDYLDNDIKSSLAAGTEQLQNIVGFPDDWPSTSKGFAVAKDWLKQYLKTQFTPDYENKAGMDIMATYLKDIFAGRGTL